MKTTVISLLLVLLHTVHADAYIGIAALLPIFGQAVIFLIIFLLALVGLFLYPIKKLISKISKRKAKAIDKRKS